MGSSSEVIYLVNAISQEKLNKNKNPSDIYKTRT